MAYRNRALFDKERSKDPVWKLYRCVQWTQRTRVAFLASNPLCQRICEDTHEQCHEASIILHHLISPRVRPDLMYRWTNIKAVCAQHHPVSEGEPLEHMDKLDQIYVPTRVLRWMK
jgi:hypothetical protein